MGNFNKGTYEAAEQSGDSAPRVFKIEGGRNVFLFTCPDGDVRALDGPWGMPLRGFSVEAPCRQLAGAYATGRAIEAEPRWLTAAQDEPSDARDDDSPVSGARKLSLICAIILAFAIGTCLIFGLRGVFSPLGF